MDLTFKTPYGRFNYRVGAIILHDGKVLLMRNPEVPYLSCPFQPAAATFHCDLRQPFQQRFPISFPTVFREDKKILQVNAGSSVATTCSVIFS